MSRRTSGVIFCLISALLYFGYYLCAAIIGTGKVTMVYEESLSGLLTYSSYSLMVGIIFLLIAEYTDYKERKNKQ